VDKEAMKRADRSDWNTKAPFTVLGLGEEEMGRVSGLEKNINKMDLLVQCQALIDEPMDHP
jgi:hypothetical protein